jgi:Ca2+-binding EF-hand superfamily protein
MAEDDPNRSSAAAGGVKGVAASKSSVVAHGNALSQLQPSQVRTLREGFDILDRDGDGTVNREDVADMLNQLGTFAV